MTDDKRTGTTGADWPAIVPADQGWMTNTEVACIAFACVATRAASVPGGVLEVGAYKGRTTSALALVCDCVTVVDTFMGGEEYGNPEVDFYGEFATNMARMSAKVAVHRGLSTDVLPTLPGPWRVALIDGAHDEETAYADIADTWPKLSVGGYMFVDDVNWDSVGAAVTRWSQTALPGSAIFASISNKLGVIKRLTEG